MTRKCVAARRLLMTWTPRSASTHATRRAGPGPRGDKITPAAQWIPACAGMTTGGLRGDKIKTLGSRGDKEMLNKKTPHTGVFLFLLVALVGLEPTLLAELDFESSASTNSATGPKPRCVYFAAAFLASTFFTRRALRFALCVGFFAGFSAGPIFLLIARLIAAISGVKRDGDLDITYASRPPCLVNVRRPAVEIRNEKSRFKISL